MKRVLLAILILSAGTTVFCALRHSTNVTRGEVAAQRHDWQSHTQHLTELRIEQRQITERWSDAKQQLATQPPLPVLTELAEKILAGAAPESYSAAERERLLAELGFSWNTTGDYLIVSKKSLEAISFATLQESTITEAARAALAITPTEQATLQASTERLKQERIEWVKANAQREEPSGSILAKYTLPEDSSLAQQQSSTFTNAVLSTLGQARGDLFQDKSWGWMGALGLLSGPGYANRVSSLSIEREPAHRDGLLFHLRSASSSMTAGVSPWQSFPDVFRPLFPGGWEELAAREGFELPKEFKQQKAQ